MTFLATPTNTPKLDTYRLFHTSFPHRPPYLCPRALRFRCSNHRLDIELGRHTQTPREQRTCRFCKGTPIGDKYHSFQCPRNMDLQVHCDIQSHPGPNSSYSCKHSPQMYNATLTSLCPVLKIHNSPPTHTPPIYITPKIYIYFYTHQSPIHIHKPQLIIIYIIL